MNDYSSLVPTGKKAANPEVLSKVGMVPKRDNYDIVADNSGIAKLDKSYCHRVMKMLVIKNEFRFIITGKRFLERISIVVGFFNQEWKTGRRRGYE
jgi:hypothetical protein